MTNLKRVVAGALSLCLAGSMLTACGSSDSSSTKGVDKEANSAAAAVGALKLTKQDSIEQTKEGSEASAKTLKIYTWNDEFKGRFRDYYSEYDKDASGYKVADDGTVSVNEKEYLKDGTEIVWVTTPSDNNAYQDKLDADLAKQADSDDKIDMFLIEADYALKYVNGPYVKPVKDLGITDADLADQYAYTQQIATDANGDLEAVTWQATPGLFAYRRDIAKEVLGTDDPEEVQAQLSDWTKFNDVAAKMKDKGYFMLSGYDDSYRTFSNNVTATWVNANMEIVVDDNLMKWVEQTKDYSDKGYNNKTSLWDDQWKADQGTSGKVFGYFYSTWGINFTLVENAEDNKGQKDGLYGDYAVCEGPQAYYWGGTWICAANGTDNPDQVADIMKQLTCNKDTMTQITKDTQDYTNTVSGMNTLAEDFSSDFLGGQNHIALFAKSAPNIDLSNCGPYDQGLNETFQAKMKDYFLGDVDLDTALDNFYTAAIEKYPDLKKPS